MGFIDCIADSVTNARQHVTFSWRFVYSCVPSRLPLCRLAQVWYLWPPFRGLATLQSVRHLPWVCAGWNESGVFSSSWKCMLYRLQRPMWIHMHMWTCDTDKSIVYFAVVRGILCGPGSSVGIAIDYGLDGPGSNLGGDEIFRPSRSALRPFQPPVKWVRGLSRW